MSEARLDRKLAERDFHNMLRETLAEQIWSPEADRVFSTDPLWANLKYYSAERKNRAFVAEWLRAHCDGMKVLDYGCGNGLDSVRIAKEMHAARVVGIDISDVSISHGRERAAREGVSDITDFHVMDAETLAFPDDSFDVVHIYGVLHHVELTRAFAELARVLRPGGHIIATEAMRHNPAIAWYRRRTPHLRTPWEADHILGRSDIALAREYFEHVDARLYNLATLLAVPFRRLPIFRPLLSMLEGIDAVLLRVPGVKWLAWMCVFTMSTPVKVVAGAPRAFAE